MKKAIEYTLLAEGYAEYEFIPIYLRRMATEKGLQIKRSSLDLLKKQPSKSKVLKEANKFCLSAFQDNNHDLFIIGIDLDGADQDPDQPQHKAECDKVEAALGTAHQNYTNKIVIYVPVQAIENWLRYQAHYTNKTLPQLPDKAAEKFGQAQLKRELYAGSNNERKIREVTRIIAQTANFAQLAVQSRSFSHFHKQITELLNTQLTAQ